MTSHSSLPHSTPQTIHAAVLYAPYDLRVETRPLPEARPGYVVLQVEAAGICGTDVAVYEGRHPATLPITLGHEFAGRVLAVGEGVDDLHPGQRVMAAGSWTADAPSNGRAGVRAGALGRTAEGCFAHAVLVPRKAVYPVPDGVDAIAAQSATTLATAIHAVERAGSLEGKRVAIVGPGHAALLLLQVCRVAGAAEIAVLGTRDNRLALASQLGADSTVNVQAPDFSAWQAERRNGEFDLVFEASGHAAGLALSFACARLGGVVVAYGIIHGPLEGVPGDVLYTKELTVVGSKGAGGRYAAALQLLASGQVRVEPLVSHVLPLADIVHGFDLTLRRLDNAVRVVFVPSDSD